MQRMRVQHTTVYRYRRPVTFGEHRLMFRPRDSHDLRLTSTNLRISPPARVRWLHDVFSNSITIATFDRPAAELVFESTIELEHYVLDDLDFPILPYARTYPFSYPAEESPDLHRLVERHYPDPDHRVDHWAKRFVQGGDGPVETGYLLGEITRAINREFRYARRHTVGTQAPTQTLDAGGGTCRDLALFMMEAVRSLGFAARFVSGYLYDAARDPARSGGSALRGGGDTHAWVQVYLPGAGWVEFDPTNGLVGSANLIRVAVARDPAQAVPLQGSYTGEAGDYLEMSVDVRVTCHPSESGDDGRATA